MVDPFALPWRPSAVRVPLLTRCPDAYAENIMNKETQAIRAALHAAPGWVSGLSGSPWRPASSLLGGRYGGRDEPLDGRPLGYRRAATDWRDRRLVFEFATGAFLHQQWYEIADPAGFEPG